MYFKKCDLFFSDVYMIQSLYVGNDKEGFIIVMRDERVKMRIFHFYVTRYKFKN